MKDFVFDYLRLPDACRLIMPPQRVISRRCTPVRCPEGAQPHHTRGALLTRVPHDDEDALDSSTPPQVSWDYRIACKPTLIGFVCDLIYVLRVDHLVGLVPELVIEV